MFGGSVVPAEDIRRLFFVEHRDASRYPALVLGAHGARLLGFERPNHRTAEPPNGFGVVMRIGVDVDDVIVETLPAYVRAFEARFARQVPLAQATWELFALHPDIPAADRLLFFEELRGDRFMFTRPPHPDAPPALRALRMAGHTLIIVSGRPLSHLTDTEAMLEAIGIRDCFAEIVHRDGQTIPEYKSWAARDRRLDVLVEDEFPAACAVAEAGVAVLLMDRPWNQAPLLPRMARVTSWAEALSRLRDWPPDGHLPPSPAPKA